MSFSDISVDGEREDCERNNIEKKCDYDIALEKLKSFFLRNNITFECLTNTAKLINSVPGATVQLPTGKRSLIKAFTSSSQLEYAYYITCVKCQKYVKCLPGESTWTCVNTKNNKPCGQQLKREKNYFVYIGLERQLKQTLEKNWDVIVAYNDVIQNDECESIRDTHSGTFIQNVLRKKMTLLNLMMNTDGLALKKSGSGSVWPLQIICNFLPPEIRYRNENILCVAFYSQDFKPDMLKFCEPFAEEIEHLQDSGFVFRDQVFRPAITCAVLDLPAKATFQNLILFNGYAMQNIHNKTCSSERGVKGISPAITFDYFDMVKSFGLDYMHCVCLGIFRNLHEFWFNPKMKHESYIIPKLQRSLDQRILSIKPCRFITRLPRPMKYFRKFKASEMRSLLLYYLPVALDGILKKKYLDHFLLLSTSIYKLLTPAISNEDIIIAENNLKKFGREYEQLYSKESMTMNVHLLTHMVFCVRNLGPLWTQSMFAFESNNATFSRYVKASKDVLSELSTKYMIHKSSWKTAHRIPDMIDELESRRKIKLNAFEVSAISAYANISIDENQEFEVRCVYTKNGERFTCVNYLPAKKTIDYVVELEDKVIGKVKFYLELDGVFYLLIEHYAYEGSFDHIHKIKPTNIISMYPAKKITKKFIYINFFQKHYITNRPNQFESD